MTEIIVWDIERLNTDIEEEIQGETGSESTGKSNREESA